MCMGDQRHSPVYLPPVKNRYAMYKKLGGPKFCLGGSGKSSPQTGFDARIVKLVACSYTD